MAGLTQSYVNGTSQKPLLGDTIGAQFDKAVARWRDHEALVVPHQDIRWTWAELKQQVDDFAAGLIELGFEPGERIGIWSPNITYFISPTTLKRYSCSASVTGVFSSARKIASRALS